MLGAVVVAFLPCTLRFGPSWYPRVRLGVLDVILVGKSAASMFFCSRLFRIEVCRRQMFEKRECPGWIFAFIFPVEPSAWL